MSAWVRRAWLCHAWSGQGIRFVMAIVAAGLVSACTGVGDGGGASKGLHGTTWLAEDIDGRGVIDSLQSSVTFMPDGRASGNAGCNRFFGDVTLDDDRVRFGALAATRRMCPEAIMNQENRFLAALAAVRRFDLRQDLLFLFDGAGVQRLRMSRIESPH